MKRDGLQIATLLLCAALLVFTIIQTRRIEKLEEQLGNQIQNLQQDMRNVESSVGRISNEITQGIEEASRLVEDYTAEPTGLKQESNSILMEIHISLRQWQADTAVQLVITQGGAESVQALQVDAAGTCVGQMEIPLGIPEEITLEAVITNGGTVTREALGGWGDYTMLLPLQVDSWGGTVPYCYDGIFVIDEFAAYPKYMGDGSLQDEAYRLYRNDEVVLTDTECTDWSVVCQAGDVVKLTYSARDVYGLHYEFTLYRAEILEDGTLSELAPEEGAGQVTLSWD